MEKNSSTSGDIALYKLMQNVWHAERNGFEKMMSYELVPARGDLKTYKEVEASQKEDR